MRELNTFMTSKSTKPIHYLCAALVSLVLSGVALEAMSAVYFEFFSKFFYRPIYLRHDSIHDWLTEFEPWGAWHRPNSSAIAQQPCFKVKYTSNSIGARDVERLSPGPSNSAIFLGDSFIEGLGVEDDNRLSNIFEKETGKGSINLGTEGSVGPLQYMMLYDAFAPRYAHDTVVIGFLPYNDFTDNDPEYPRWKNETFRYRPYYKRTNSGYQVFYTGTFEYGRTFNSFRESYIAANKSAIVRYTWTGGFLFAMRGQLPARNIDIERDLSTGYFENSRERLEAAYYFLDTIIKKASEKRIYILIIPNYSEAKALRTRQSPWVPEFVARFQGGQVTVIDLGPIFAGLSDEKLRSSFLQCDGHWSALGNQIAAEALIDAFSKKRLAPFQAKGPTP
jgi:hypothetical protein